MTHNYKDFPTLLQLTQGIDLTDNQVPRPWPNNDFENQVYHYGDLEEFAATLTPAQKQLMLLQESDARGAWVNDSRDAYDLNEFLGDYFNQDHILPLDEAPK